MNVSIDKSFEKDTNKINNKELLSKIVDCIENVKNGSTIHSIKNLKKLKGSNHYYRIKIGDYRVGIFIEKETVEFIRFLHRKDVYKYFP
jgi:mRNA interferase RelE/StbE